MSSEPFWYPLIRIAIALACGLLGLAAMVLVGVVTDAPIRALSQYVASFGAAGSITALIALAGGVLVFSRWATRRDERRQIAATGTLEHRRPTFVREGLGRNLAILLAPLAMLVLVLLALLFSGIPLPGPGR